VSSPYSDLERAPLRSDSLTRALVRDGSTWREVRVLDSAPSTNAVVAAEAAFAEGLVVVAEHQTAGRGRLDRTWVSPPRAGLTFSVLLRPPVADNRWPWLPLVIGVAVAEAVEEMSGVGVGLKWPNDLLVDGRKVGGILLERHGSAAVVGVGINVTSTADELPGPEATSLLLADAAVTDRESLLRAVLRSISRRYAQWCAADDSGQLAAAYTDRCETIGSDVQVRFPDRSTVAGRAERIDGAGRLVVVDETGEHALSAGDVFHVRTGG
jgi:BirA family biotin operon repressor/biotin-[acetyl-CoA-carboxylase] ligase